MSALRTAGADELQDPSVPLTAWLRRQPCIAEVTGGDVILTYPGTLEMRIVLRKDAAGVSRKCLVEVALATGGKVGVHRRGSTSDTDTRCSLSEE